MSLGRPTKVAVTRMAAAPPSPKQAFRYPDPPWPRSSTSRAMTTENASLGTPIKMAVIESPYWVP